jgi:hypothetical protein
VTIAGKRVLAFGRMASVLEPLLAELRGLGLKVEGSIQAETVAESFDARDFDLLVFGSGMVGPLTDRLKAEFQERNPELGAVETFAPVAVKQIVAALEGKPGDRWLRDFAVERDGGSLVVEGRIREACRARIELFSFGTALETTLAGEWQADEGAFERRVAPGDAAMLMLTVNDEEFHVYRITDGRIMNRN